MVLLLTSTRSQVEHEDLKENIWVNDDEIEGNGLDDDKNGYVDDIHGWSFISGPGGDVKEDNLEFTRIYKDLFKRFNGKDPSSISAGEKAEYERYKKFKSEYESRVKKMVYFWLIKNNI